MSLETSRPRRGLCGYPIDAALVTRRSQRNEPEIAMTQEQGHPRYWDAVREYSVAMSGPAATPGESRRSALGRIPRFWAGDARATR